LSTAPSEPAARPAPTGAQIELRRDGASAVVTEVGAGLRSWRAGGEELLDTFAADAVADSYRGKVLAPWPNRIRDGRYAFGGRAYGLPLNEPERGAALHGLVLDAPFAVAARSTHAVTLAYDLRPQPGYPFGLALEVSYELGAGGLEFTLRATNTGDRPAPFGGGLHPYFAGRADDWVLELPAATRVPVDDRMLPSGPPVSVAGTADDFTRARPVGRRAIDTCVGDLARDGDGRARVRLARRDRAIELWLDERFRFVHVYTADAVDDLARARAGIAIEPITCAPDAFNSGAGLEVLDPGASFTARGGFAAAGFRPMPALPQHKE
jgi:aldose 1-epimerase